MGNIQKILISDFSSYKAAVIARHIKLLYPYIKIITCDTHNSSKWLHSKYSDEHHIIQGNPKNQKQLYVQEITQLITTKTIDLFLPVHSSEMKLLLENRERFGSTLSYWGNLDSYNTLNSKDLLMEFARNLNIRIPRTYTILDSINDYPFVAKPTNSSSSKGVRYIHNAQEKALVMKNKPDDNYIYQEYIYGFGAGLSVFCVKGEIKTFYGHKRIGEFPASGGSSVARTGYSNTGMLDIARRLIYETNWSGFCMFEYKITNSGEAILIEANPRVWGSINQGLENNINYFETLLGPAKQIAKVKTNINTYLSPLIYLSIFQYLITAQWSSLFNCIKSLWNGSADINFFKDPIGWIAQVLRI